MPDANRDQPTEASAPPQPADAFHAHLDECEWCANQPFFLCPIGASLLRSTASLVAPTPAPEPPETSDEWDDICAHRNCGLPRKRHWGPYLGCPGHAINETMQCFKAAPTPREATRQETPTGCPCTLIEPCSPNCTCANPVMSGGCRRCASYGSQEQRIAAATCLAALQQQASEADARLGTLAEILATQRVIHIGRQNVGGENDEATQGSRYHISIHGAGDFVWHVADCPTVGEAIDRARAALSRGQPE